MAPSSSSSSQAKYDVFLSFRGEDTRRIFTSHLYAALCQKNISTFIDDEEIKRGDELSPTLLGAIEGSKISIIIFSENYASSAWCLDELVKIIECKNAKQQIMIPIFYNIEPLHVRKQSGPYKDAFTKHKKHNQCKIQKWRLALHEAANSAGWASSNIRRDSMLVQHIVEDVLQKLNHIIDPQLGSGLVGIQKSIAYVESLLCIESTDVRIIGLWGIEGIGKTTIAEVLFKIFSSQFEGCCFVENVREDWKNRGKNEIRNKLRTQVLGDHKLHISPYTLSSAYVENRLQRRKILIVLDDVSDSQQMEYLVGDKNGFGPGSRIIVTTKNKDVLKKGIDELYEVMPLSDEEALQLFSLKAFQQDHPIREFIHLSKMVVNYAKGIPLVLEVLGSLLYSKSQTEWESALQKLKKVPNAEIHRVLRLSYGELDYKFFHTDDQFERYAKYKSKIVQPLKCWSLNFLKESRLELYRILEKYKLLKFVTYSATCYPRMVKMFYSNLGVSTGKLFVHVMSRAINVDVPLLCQLFDMDGESSFVTSKDIEDYSREEAIKLLFPNVQPTFATGKLMITGLSVEDHLLHYTIVKIILPRNTNSTNIVEDELFLMWAMKKGYHINIPYLIITYMATFFTKPNVSLLPYGMILSEIFAHYRLSTHMEKEVIEVDSTTSINECTMHQMQLTLLKERWVKHDGTGAAGPSRSEASGSGVGTDAGSEDYKIKTLTLLRQIQLQHGQFFGKIEQQIHAVREEINGKVDALAVNLDAKIRDLHGRFNTMTSHLNEIKQAVSPED